MTKLSMDTLKIKTAGEDIKKISTDYGNLISEMYGKINNIPESGMWSSESDKGSASVFASSVMKDKKSAYSLKNSMDMIGNSLINYAKSVENSSDNVF